MAKPKGPPLFAVDAVRALQRGLVGLVRRMAPAPVPLLEIVSGHWRVHAIGAIARLGIPDLLAGGARDVGELARQAGVHEDALFRVLRALASDGILDRPSPRTFALNATSEPLRTDHPVSMHNTVLQITSTWSQRAWVELASTVRDGTPAFPRVFGGDLWRYFEGAPNDGREFHRSMQELSRLDVPAIAAAWDFGQHARLVDVGGGSGELLAGLLAAYPSLHGTVYDTEAATREAADTFAKAGVSARAEVVIGDFFERVPEGFDAYVMRQIVHGHTEDQLTRVLGHLRTAMAPGAKLLICDTLVPEHDEGLHPAFLDLQMLIGSGGRERTKREMSDLLERNGLHLRDVRRTPAPTAIFVAERG